MPADVPERRFTFTLTTARPGPERVACHHCDWTAKGGHNKAWPQAAAHVCRVYCDNCGREARNPAISIGLTVVCAGCARSGVNGLEPGEHGTGHTIEEWRRLAAIRQGRSTATPLAPESLEDTNE